jgi:hypothetical protein
VDVLIALVISILCVVELLILSFKYIETVFKKAALAAKGLRQEPSRGIGSIHYSYMRPAIFLFLFGVDFSAVLIPLQMENLYEPMLGLPKDFIIALPVTAMFASVGITFLIAGAWMDRRGWNEPFITGVILTGVCKLYAWMAPDAAHFIVAMGGVGFGYGLALMAAQGFVMASTNDQEKAHGIAFSSPGCMQETSAGWRWAQWSRSTSPTTISSSSARCSSLLPWPSPGSSCGLRSSHPT